MFLMKNKCFKLERMVFFISKAFHQYISGFFCKNRFYSINHIGFHLQL